MDKHHEASIEALTQSLSQSDEVLAVIVCGSIAHGFQTSQSDVDIMIVISDEDYEKRKASNQLHYYNTEACAYDGGYVDGKYTSVAFIKEVALKGSEPARFAFEGAFVTYSKIEGLFALVKEAASYPIHRKHSNIERFYAQFEAWKWYCDEAFKQENTYLLYHAISQFTLFSGRLILAHNEMLYPYHKWFLKILATAPKQPEGLMAQMHQLLDKPEKIQVDRLYELIKQFNPWDGMDQNWTSIFMRDSELNWLTGHTPVADL